METGKQPDTTGNSARRTPRICVCPPMLENCRKNNRKNDGYQPMVRSSKNALEHKGFCAECVVVGRLNVRDTFSL